ncbi:MAG: CDGSH iron-sulfur domain-containing protein [Alphaproteobacteria bacterium]|uniref:CDGSH iron-sulfur domain-containing protein n=1 Tax=Pacificispira sp. TaxID=2888761 RepID=UPI002EC4970B|nr:CDGSH iron-sulfur domain-containing protein [Pseudomonadota bacterium]
MQVEQGRTYLWCACGRSSSQPFCDGTHAGTGEAPIRYTAERSRLVYFCGCRLSSRGPLCDGSHSKI